MKDTATAFTYELTDLDQATWKDRVEDIAEDHGYAEPIGSDHTALLIDGGRKLLVSFESVPCVRRQNDDAAPMGWGFVQSHGWSSLTLLADAEVDWFRHEAVFGYFDRMIDDGFFDDFEQILFYGAGAAGYAAAALSVAAPDTNVLVLQPQSTLDRTRVPWDRRFPKSRRLDFKTRFGYAPIMVETAETVVVIHDPSVVEDAVHASLFDGANTTHLTCPYLSPDVQHSLSAMDVLPDMIEHAMNGTLTPDAFATLWRERRLHSPYLRRLMRRLEAKGGHDRLLARLCRHVTAGTNRPIFAKKLAELDARGVTL